MSDEHLHELRARIERARAELAEIDAERENAERRLARLEDELAARAPGPDVHVPPTRPRSTAEKVSLFRSLFRGRTNIFPLRWQNANTGRAGYSPACANEWIAGICEKPKIRCGDCPNQAFLPVTGEVIIDHLKGRHVAGLYPLLENETCWLLAADFDGDGWEDDIEALLAACEQQDVCPAIERSRSGNGAHAWFFFSAPVSASLARKMGSFLLTSAMSHRPQLPMSSYDRLFPNQDTMPRGGFGNLIALPFQDGPRQQGNTIFIDRSGRPYVDQWMFLASIQRLTPDRVREIAQLADHSGGAIGLSRDGVREAAPGLSRGPSSGPPTQLPDRVEAIHGAQLQIDVSELPPALVDRIKRIAAFENPEFHKRQAMRLSTALTPRVIHSAEHDRHGVRLPRGCLSAVVELLRAQGAALAVEDNRSEGTSLDVEFHGELTEPQAMAARALLAHDIGILVAPPGSGKTVVGTSIIASRRRSTLVLVHRTQLLEQWRTQLGVFLDLPPKRVGQIGGGRRRRTGEIDVAMIQSLARGRSIEAPLEDYGQVIVDECHHVPAVSFERVMNRVTAKHLIGLTATPQRRDGHEPILGFQLGPVRFTIPERGGRRCAFRRELVVRDTAFQLDDPETLGIQPLYAALAADTHRNDLIFDDVVRALHNGRSPLLLTERRDHLDYWAERLKPFVRHLVVLHGGMRRKARRDALARLACLGDEERLVIATGRFAGEGFDDARLDTLFLTLPVSWRGTLVQYAGRLHRSHRGKEVVRIHDYHDRLVSMLAKMFEKRVRGYRSMGYRLVEDDGGREDIHHYVVEYDV